MTVVERWAWQWVSTWIHQWVVVVAWEACFGSTAAAGLARASLEYSLGQRLCTSTRLLTAHPCTTPPPPAPALEQGTLDLNPKPKP